MALDPTLEDMTAFLRQKTAGLSDWREWQTECMARIAIHYFASHHYAGQFSNLYQAICSIDYHTPNEMELEDEPDEEVHFMYKLLTDEYAK